jgi:hypothetical protein
VPYAVDFNIVSTVGLESSPVAEALAGLRAHERVLTPGTRVSYAKYPFWMHQSAKNCWGTL